MVSSAVLKASAGRVVRERRRLIRSFFMLSGGTGELGEGIV